MKNLLSIVIIITVLLMIGAIMLQNQGSGLGSAFGGESNFYRSKRGVEKLLFYATVILASVFVVSVFATILIK